MIASGRKGMGRERGGRGTGARAGRCGWGAGWECGRAKACWSRAQAGVRTVAALVGRSVRPLAFCEYAAELGGCGCEGRGAPSDVSEERRAASVRVVGESAPCRRSGCGFLRGRILRGRGGERDFGEREGSALLFCDEAGSGRNVEVAPPHCRPPLSSCKDVGGARGWRCATAFSPHDVTEA